VRQLTLARNSAAAEKEAEMFFYCEGLKFKKEADNMGIKFLPIGRNLKTK